MYCIYRNDSRTFSPQIPISKLGCGDLSRCRLPPVINHSTLAYVCHYPGADCHQSSTIPPWPMCVTIQGQTATSHQPFHPGLCVSLSRGRLSPVINHSPLAYVCHGSTTFGHRTFSHKTFGHKTFGHKTFGHKVVGATFGHSLIFPLYNQIPNQEK